MNISSVNKRSPHCYSDWHFNNKQNYTFVVIVKTLRQSPAKSNHHHDCRDVTAPEVPVVIDHLRAEPQPHFEPWLTCIRAWTRDPFSGRDWWRGRRDVNFVTWDAHLLWRGDLTGISVQPTSKPARLSVKNYSAIKTVNYQGHTVGGCCEGWSSHIYGWWSAWDSLARRSCVECDAGVQSVVVVCRECSMDDPQTMMHPAVSQHTPVNMVPQHGYGMPQEHNTGQAPQHETDVRKHDISEILQQIMNITDQSLDEAQARWVGPATFEKNSMLLTLTLSCCWPWKNNKPLQQIVCCVLKACWLSANVGLILLFQEAYPQLPSDEACPLQRAMRDQGKNR